MTKKTVSSLIAMSVVAAFCAQASLAQSVDPSVSTDLIDQEVISELETMLNSPVILHAIAQQNTARGDMAQSEIDALDLAWRAEVNSDGVQPLIAAALGGPASTYLLRAQASSKGLLSEIFVMDRYGLNVAQSSVTSDFWQGDEAKYQRTFPEGAGAIFIDEPEFNDEFGVWLTQVNLTISDGSQPIGVGTVEVNLSELARRRAYQGS